MWQCPFTCRRNDAFKHVILGLGGNSNECILRIGTTTNMHINIMRTIDTNKAKWRKFVFKGE